LKIDFAHERQRENNKKRQHDVKNNLRRHTLANKNLRQEMVKTWQHVTENNSKTY